MLNTEGGPWLISPKHNDPVKNPQQPVVIADPQTGQYWLTGCYYAMWHFGRINPGSTRIVVEEAGASSGGDGAGVYPTLSHVAFYDASEESYTVVLMNADKDPHTMTLTFPGNEEQVLEVMLPPSSLLTLTVTV